MGGQGQPAALQGAPHDEARYDARLPGHERLPESKDWCADPANRLCDAPGSWYCTGQYPPALAKLIAKRRNFAQLEDFNKDGSGQKSAYTKLVEQELQGKKRQRSEM